MAEFIDKLDVVARFAWPGTCPPLLLAPIGINIDGAARTRPAFAIDCSGLPARLIQHGSRLTLRLPPDHDLLVAVLTRIRELPVAA